MVVYCVSIRFIQLIMCEVEFMLFSVSARILQNESYGFNADSVFCCLTTVKTS